MSAKIEVQGLERAVPFFIRKARIGDIPEIFRIEVDSFIDPYAPFLLMNLLAMYPTGFLVAESLGRVHGYVICRQVGVKGHIIALAVDKTNRKSGVGAELLKKAENGLRDFGANGFWLEVRESNYPAQFFYLKQGYNRLHTVSSYYDDGECAEIFYKNFST